VRFGKSSLLPSFFLLRLPLALFSLIFSIPLSIRRRLGKVFGIEQVRLKKS
jgi:lauroyl/myristoyl acyltransferase